MTEGILRLSGPVLSAWTVEAIEQAMLRPVAAGAIMRRATARFFQAAVRGRSPPAWVFAIGLGLYAGYEAYNEREVDWTKLEEEQYSANDLAVFRRGFSEANRQFLVQAAGVAATANRWKYILIPSEIMPVVAGVDLRGIERLGNILQWEPAGANARRRGATAGRGSAGVYHYSDGTFVRGSWEEYPFAVTTSLIAGPAQVEQVPLRENWVQGGFIRAASLSQGFVPGDTVRCYVF